MRKFLLVAALTLPVVSMAYDKVDKEAFFDAGVLVSCVDNRLLSPSDARPVYLRLNENPQISDILGYNKKRIYEKKLMLESYGEKELAKAISSFNEGERYGTNIDRCYNLWAKYTSNHI